MEERQSLLPYLLVVFVILILLAVFTPVWFVSEYRPPALSSNNMKQIYTFFLKHRTETRQVWAYNEVLVKPFDEASGATFYAAKPVQDGTQFTVASFWELARVYDLSPDLFNNPSAEPAIFTVPRQGLESIDEIQNDIQEWSKMDIPQYMLDWSAPRTATKHRAIMCTRYAIEIYGDYMHVCYADGRIEECQLDDAGQVIFDSADGIGDDIMTAAGDEVLVDGEKKDRTLVLGRGHRDRAMMK